MKDGAFGFLKNFYRLILSHKIISTVAVVALVYAGDHYLFPAAAAQVSYQYTVAKRGSITSTISGTGQVTPNSQVDLKPKVNANVTGVYVRSGDRVTEGQVLFRLDATDAYKQVRDATTALESAELSLKKLQTPQTADLLSINNSIKQEEDSKKDQDTKVSTALRSLLNTGIQAIPDVSYTTETAPTISGSYTKTDQGDLKISVYQGGTSGYSFSLSGIATGSGSVNTLVPQPLGDTGLYIKWNNSNPQTNWIIQIPNKQSSSYSSAYNSWQTAIDNRTIANAASDRNIASLQQKLKDLSPGDDNLDVQSAKLQIEQKENALLDAKTTLANYVITAPFDGVMASVSVDIGSSAVMASANSSTALGTIVTDKKLAQITLNESDIVKVHLGQKAKVTFEAIDGLTLDGEVVEITTLGTVTSGVVTYKAKVAFASDDVRILPNMSVSVDITTDSKDDVLYVPTQAVKHDANGYYVETDDTAGMNFGSSTRRFAAGNATSTTGFGSTTRMFNGSASSSNATSTYRNRRTGSSTYPRASNTSGTASTALTRIPVTIGTQSDTQTEITSGLVEGQRIILKKSTITAAASTAAPSITSLFRPANARATAGGNGGFNRGQ